MKLTSIPQLARNANRLREIVTILSKYGLADWISRLNLDFARGFFKRAEGPGLTDCSHEARVRLALVELGTTFIKLGQMLSTRADLVGPDLARELTTLQADTPADTPEIVRATLLAELGRPIEQLFADFDDKPLASASIGQVHRARLLTGEAVVVKVQHAGIVSRVRNDLDILIGLAELAERYLDEMRPYRPRTTAIEFQRVLLRELDFRREQRNLDQFNRHFAKDKSVHFPIPYPELSTSRILTMEWLDGVPLADPERLREIGFDLDTVAQRGARVFLDMIFRDGLYHADPHPGNILVLGGGVIGMLDCGMVGRLDDDVRDQIGHMLVAVAKVDADGLTASLLRLCNAQPGLDFGDLRADVGEFLGDYATQALDHFDLGGALTEITVMIRRYHIALPTKVALLLKVLVMLEGTGRLLSPRFNLTDLLRPYYKRLIVRRLSPRRHLQRLGRLYRELEHLGEVVPRGLIDIVQQTRAGRLAVHLEHKRLEPSVNRLVFGLLTSALFLGSAQLWSSNIGPRVDDVSLPGAVGCTLSLVLGLRLLWAIWNSGKLDRSSPDTERPERS